MMAEKNPQLLELFAAPESHEDLSFEGEAFVSKTGARFPVVRGIPRFVPDDSYVASFSYEWNTHNETQLDCHTGSTSSEDMFREKTGLTPEDLKGKTVLDAGVGAGRFCDVMSRWGAQVVGIDLSFAVEASSHSFRDRDNVIVAQADIGKPPFRPESFDYIVSIGVLHHTPDTKSYFEALLPFLKPGGTVAIWLYPDTPDYVTRKAWIPYTSKIPDRWFYAWCNWFVPFMHRRKERPIFRSLYRAFPFSDQSLGLENDILDTFDGYSPQYHGVHSVDEVFGWFRENGLVDIENPSSYLTSVRGRKPV